jgi:hypothetical protein
MAFNMLSSGVMPMPPPISTRGRSCSATSTVAPRRRLASILRRWLAGREMARPGRRARLRSAGADPAIVEDGKVGASGSRYEQDRTTGSTPEWPG